MIQEPPEAPNPVILRDHPGYRISFHPSGRSARILLITFGSVSSGITTRGWGTGFAAKHGYDNIYVAQRKSSQYQDLPLEDFKAAVEPYIDRYERVITYGASLGGYCAIYYGGCIDAQIIAISPHNSVHPLIGRKSFVLLPFAHRQIAENPRSSLKPIIAYDPTLPDDQAFIDYLIRPTYPELRLARFPHGGHALLETMNNDGVLADFILPLIEKDQIVPVTLRREGSRIWHAEYGRDLIQQKRFDDAETHLRTSFRLEMNKHAARGLAKVYALTGRAEDHPELNGWFENERLRQGKPLPQWLPVAESVFFDGPRTAFAAGTYTIDGPPKLVVNPGMRKRLARQPGYSLTYHGAPVPSRSLVIGFGRATVGLNKSGMGRTFTREHGLDYVYVGQRKGSDYQELSLESFRAAMAPILDRYDHILTMGVGLGGYAALYYGGSIGARVVALNPVLGRHPQLPKPSDGPYLHKPLTDVPIPAGEPIVVWDPARPRQNRFIRNVVKPAFPQASYYPLKTNSPVAYGPLRQSGKLDELLLDQLHGAPHPGTLSVER